MAWGVPRPNGSNHVFKQTTQVLLLPKALFCADFCLRLSFQCDVQMARFFLPLNHHTRLLLGHSHAPPYFPAWLPPCLEEIRSGLELELVASQQRNHFYLRSWPGRKARGVRINFVAFKTGEGPFLPLGLNFNTFPSMKSFLVFWVCNFTKRCIM